MDNFNNGIRKLVVNYLCSPETPVKNDKHLKKFAKKRNVTVSSVRGRFNKVLDDTFISGEKAHN